MKTLSSFIAVLFLLTLSFSAQAGSIIEELKNEGVLKLYHDYRSGHVLDLSGNANHGALSGSCSFQGRGIHIDESTFGVTISTGSNLRITTGTYMVLATIYKVGSWQQFINTNTITPFFGLRSANEIFLRSGADYSVSTGLSAIPGRHSYSASFVSGTSNKFYLDGGSETNGSSQALSWTPTQNIVFIGPTKGTSEAPDGVIEAVVICDRVLTAAEMSALHGELVNLRWPTKPVAGAKEGLGLGPELYADGDMEAAGTGSWVPVGVTPTKESGRALAGNQVLRLTRSRIDWGGAKQEVLTIGKTYRVTGWCRGDGTTLPRFSGGIYYWTGTTSTDWQWIDFIAVAVGTSLYCYVGGGGIGNWAEWDNLSVKEVLHPQIQWKSDYGPATTGNITSGFIGDTPWQVSSGTWKINTDTVAGRTAKVLECVADGIAYMPVSAMGISPSEAAYGTWDFWAYKEDADEIEIAIVADVIGGRSAAGQDGYSLVVEADEDILLTESSAGTPATRITGSESATADSWERYRITRADDGDFVLYLDGSSIGSVDNEATVTSSDYIILDFDAGDKLALGDVAGDRSFVKYKGVVAP